MNIQTKNKKTVC